MNYSPKAKKGEGLSDPNNIISAFGNVINEIRLKCNQIVLINASYYILEDDLIHSTYIIFKCKLFVELVYKCMPFGFSIYIVVWFIQKKSK